MSKEEQTRREAQGQRVLMARTAARLSRQKFATQVSNLWEPVSREYVRRVEVGEKDPGYGFFLAASEVTGQPVPWFTDLGTPPLHVMSGYAEWFRRPIDVNASTGEPVLRVAA